MGRLGTVAFACVFAIAAAVAASESIASVELPPPTSAPANNNNNNSDAGLCFGYNISGRVCCGRQRMPDGEERIYTCPAGYQCGPGVCTKGAPSPVISHFGVIGSFLALAFLMLICCGFSRCCARIGARYHRFRATSTRTTPALATAVDFATDSDDDEDAAGRAAVVVAAPLGRGPRAVRGVVVAAPADDDASAPTPQPDARCPYGPAEGVTGYGDAITNNTDHGDANLDAGNASSDKSAPANAESN